MANIIISRNEGLLSPSAKRSGRAVSKAGDYTTVKILRVSSAELTHSTQVDIEDSNPQDHFAQPVTEREFAFLAAGGGFHLSLAIPGYAHHPKLLVLAPSGSGKTYHAKRGLWRDGDSCVMFPMINQWWNVLDEQQQDALGIRHLEILDGLSDDIVAFNPGMNALKIMVGQKRLTRLPCYFFNKSTYMGQLRLRDAATLSALGTVAQQPGASEAQFRFACWQADEFRALGFIPVFPEMVNTADSPRVQRLDLMGGFNPYGNGQTSAHSLDFLPDDIVKHIQGMDAQTRAAAIEAIRADMIENPNPWVKVKPRRDPAPRKKETREQFQNRRDKIKCFRCDGVGHTKANCPYQASGGGSVVSSDRSYRDVSLSIEQRKHSSSGRTSLDEVSEAAEYEAALEADRKAIEADAIRREFDRIDDVRRNLNIDDDGDVMVDPKVVADLQRRLEALNGGISSNVSTDEESVAPTPPELPMTPPDGSKPYYAYDVNGFRAVHSNGHSRHLLEQVAMPDFEMQPMPRVIAAEDPLELSEGAVEYHDLPDSHADAIAVWRRLVIRHEKLVAKRLRLIDKRGRLLARKPDSPKIAKIERKLVKLGVPRAPVAPATPPPRLPAAPPEPIRSVPLRRVVVTKAPVLPDEPKGAMPQQDLIITGFIDKSPPRPMKPSIWLMAGAMIATFGLAAIVVKRIPAMDATHRDLEKSIALLRQHDKNGEILMAIDALVVATALAPAMEEGVKLSLAYGFKRLGLGAACDVLAVLTWVPVECWTRGILNTRAENRFTIFALVAMHYCFLKLDRVNPVLGVLAHATWNAFSIGQRWALQTDAAEQHALESIKPVMAMSDSVVRLALTKAAARWPLLRPILYRLAVVLGLAAAGYAVYDNFEPLVSWLLPETVQFELVTYTRSHLTADYRPTSQMARDIKFYDSKIAVYKVTYRGLFHTHTRLSKVSMELFANANDARGLVGLRNPEKWREAVNLRCGVEDRINISRYENSTDLITHNTAEFIYYHTMSNVRQHISLNVM